MTPEVAAIKAFSAFIWIPLLDFIFKVFYTWVIMKIIINVFNFFKNAD